MTGYYCEQHPEYRDGLNKLYIEIVRPDGSFLSVIEPCRGHEKMVEFGVWLSMNLLSVVRQHNLYLCPLCGGTDIVVYFESFIAEQHSKETAWGVMMSIWYWCLECGTLSKWNGKIGIEYITVKKNTKIALKGNTVSGMEFMNGILNEDVHFSEKTNNGVRTQFVVYRKRETKEKHKKLQDAIQFTNGVFSNLLGGDL